MIKMCFPRFGSVTVRAPFTLDMVQYKQKNRDYSYLWMSVLLRVSRQVESSTEMIFSIVNPLRPIVIG